MFKYRNEEMDRASKYKVSTVFGDAEVLVKDFDEHRILTEAAIGKASEAEYNFAMYLCDRNHDYLVKQRYSQFKNKLKCGVFAVTSALLAGFGILSGEATVAALGGAGAVAGINLVAKTRNAENDYIELINDNIDVKQSAFEENPEFKEPIPLFENYISF